MNPSTNQQTNLSTNQPFNQSTIKMREFTNHQRVPNIPPFAYKFQVGGRGKIAILNVLR